jgi:hypothetical protein
MNPVVRYSRGDAIGEESAGFPVGHAIGYEIPRPISTAFKQCFGVASSTYS